jgi:hypothetical protein
MCERILLASASDVVVDTMLALVDRVMPRTTGDPGGYFRARLRRYPMAVLAHDAQGLAAFALVDELQEGDGRFHYLGPVISSRRAFLPLLRAVLEDALDRTPPGQVLWLAGELQNPRVLAGVETLFPTLAWPRWRDGHVSAEARAAAALFARRLGHIHDLDLATLRTRTGESLFRSERGHPELLERLRARGVHLERGDCQMVLVGCGPSPAERARFSAEMQRGLARLSPAGRGGPGNQSLCEDRSCLGS